MLRWRLISSAAILTVLAGVCWLDFRLGAAFRLGGLAAAPVLVLLSLAASYEVLDLLRHKSLRPAGWSVYVGNLLIVTAASVPALWQPYPPHAPLDPFGWTMCALGLGVALAFIAELRRYEAPGGLMIKVGLAVFTLAYVGVLLSFLAALRLFHSNAWGLAALLSLLAVVKMSDVGAYAVGRLLGRTKLAPRLSPGKTVEGAVGGFAAACLTSWVFFQFLAPLLTGAPAGPPWRVAVGSAVYGLIVCAAGMVGDLAESLLKRDTDSKDSSTWLKGLGGVLDVLDSILMAAPPAYVLWASGIVGPDAR